MIRKLRHAIGLVALFLATVVVAGTGSTLALWDEVTIESLANAGQGDLDFTVTGASWRVVDGAGAVVTQGNSMASLSGLRSPCGTGLRLEVTHTVDVVLTGDNLAGYLTLTWTAGQPTGSYSMLDSGNGVVVSQRSTAAPYTITLPAGSDTYRVIVVYPLGVCDAFATAASAKYGGLQLSLQQAREA
ncbi:MAG: hypothetical protein LBR27_10070 [Bifidobacteriaceae bacterium]|nr:hypothetical protein [Bifidobacteriaceae bacterium]